MLQVDAGQQNIIVACGILNVESVIQLKKTGIPLAIGIQNSE